MISVAGRPIRLMVSCLALLGLGACTYQNLSESGVGQSQTFFWGKPKYGMHLCLSVEPGTPVMEHPGGGAVIGYTRDVVALWSEQIGQYISVIHYNGALGWIDGMKIRPYHGPRPGMTCIIPGNDIHQRPIFLIR